MNPPKQDFSQSLTRVDPDEKLLAVIKRHVFGIVRLYVIVFLGIAAGGGLIMYILPDLVSRDDNPGIYSIVALASVVIIAFMAIILVIATAIYFKSQLVVTDKSITQTLQVSLFNKKVSQLAVSSIEDVTADTNGIFPTLLGYGKLFVETAGEQENFHFEYCPHADHYAKLILETRQQFMGTRELEMREAGNAYANQMQSQQTPQQAVAAAYQQPMPQPMPEPQPAPQQQAPAPQFQQTQQPVPPAGSTQDQTPPSNSY